MSNTVKKTAGVEVPPEKAKKAWKKPVLDILELQSAEHGVHGLPDHGSKHMSH